MKRKLPVIIILAIIMVFSVGCSELPSFKVEGKQNTEYIVLSNGGSAVQYGNYIYFINGYDGYEDESGKSNLFGKIEKGAVYRAELYGKDHERNFDFSFGSVTKKTFLPERNPSTGLYIKTTTHRILKGYEKDKDDKYLKDENGDYIEIREDVEYADVQRIAPKKVGTTDFEDGGIFIFDDYIFYASPSNRKNREGEVQTQKTDFYRAKLDGSKTEIVYTSENDTSASAYMFYKYAGSYYLVVQDGKEVKSIKMDKKIHKPVVIGEGVSDVHFPNKKIYYTGMPENTVEDFIYIVREPIDSDPTRLGNVLEAKRPDGSQSYVIAANGSTVEVIGTDNGVLFYKSNDTIRYTNLVELTSGEENVEDAIAKGKVRRIAGAFEFSAKRYSNFKCINPNPKNLDDVYLIGMSSNGLFILDRLGNERRLYQKESIFVGIQGNYLYFTAGFDKNGSTVNMLARINMFLEGAAPESILNTDKVSKDPTFKYDILPDFIVYFSNIDNDAKDYTFFKELDDLTAEGIFVGYRTAEDTIPEADLYPDEDEDEDTK